MSEKEQDLVVYHLNPVKTGQIVNQMREEYGESVGGLSRRIGESYDVVSNIIRGRGGLSLERAFKICVALRFPLESFMRLNLKGDNISFWDDILLYDITTGKTVPMTDPRISDIPSSVSSELATVATVAASIPFDVPPSVPTMPRADIIAQYEARIAELKAHIDSLERINAHLMTLFERR